MHVPVLLQDVLHALAPRSCGVYLDGTLGAAGYAEAILRASEPDGVVVGLDLDGGAVERASERLRSFGERFIARHGGFHDAVEILASLGITGLDGAVLDLGLSSDQLEDPERGFSFQSDGPLDMRFDRASGPSLMEYLRSMDAKTLEEAISTYGEERYARKVASGIVEVIRRGEAETTGDLARLVARIVRGPRGKIHPATRTFQGLRIAVNREMDNLDRALERIPGQIKPGGRFCVVSYHSVEDRRVKLSFRERKRDAGKWLVVTPKPIRPSTEETRVNPRSRSARMRVLEALPSAGHESQVVEEV